MGPRSGLATCTETGGAGISEWQGNNVRGRYRNRYVMFDKFENGAMGSLETSRFATGRKNFNSFEIYGDRGSILFDQERMNELQFFSLADGSHAQGFRTILVTEPEHPYVGHWWPPGHIIGYEHAFVHAMADFLKAIDGDGKIEPNFRDGIKIMEVLEAGIKSAETGQTVSVGKIES